MYCTVENIASDLSLKTLIELSNDYDGAETVNYELVEGVINDQSIYINSYLKGVYPLPIINSEDLVVLKSICISLVVCALYTKRIQLDYPDSLISRRKNAITDLEKIQKGIIKLHSIEQGVEKKSTRYISKRKQIFTDEVLSRI